MKELMLTTIDNPFNPFTQFDQWLQYDESSGHHTSAHIARVIVTSEELSENQQIQAYNDAVEFIMKNNITGMFRVVSRNLKTE